LRSSASSHPFKVATVQDAPVFLNLGASLRKARTLIEEAASLGASVVAFPETWLPGYPVWLDFAPEAALWDSPPAKVLYRHLVNNSISLPGRHLDELLDAARETGTYLVMGAHERLGTTLYNTMIFVGRDGKSYQIHRKLMPTYTERLLWGRGDGSTLDVMATECGNLGGLICWEHWMPLARAAMHARHETVHVAQWPAVKELHQIASRHYAFEGQCFVLAAGSILSHTDVLEGLWSLGEPDGAALALLESMPGQGKDLILRGGSAIISPDASYIQGPLLDQQAILCAEIDPESLTEGHLTLDTTGHYSRPDVFTLTVNNRPQEQVSFAAQREESA
jgi:predicted amidohydrolase